MNPRIFNAVSGRLSLRPPQAEALRRLGRAIEAAPDLLAHQRDVDAVLAALKTEFSTLEEFEREFPSLCFALATGVGKTRLMGAFISYLHLAHGLRDFFVLAPNLTIYDKLITDFTPNTPKYVFKGIAEFAAYPPEIITGDNYEQRAGTLGLLSPVTVNIFNISKINSEVRGGKSPRIKRLSEYLGDSYFNYLAELPDLVLVMDESHRYRASAGVRAINELQPLFGLELTATPFVESNRGPVPFKNVVLDYPLARALDDGFVKQPAVVTQRDFDAKNHATLFVSATKIRVRQRTAFRGDSGARRSQVVPPGQRAVPNFLPPWRGATGIRAGFRSGDGRLYLYGGNQKTRRPGLRRCPGQGRSGAAVVRPCFGIRRTARRQAVGLFVGSPR